MASYVIAGVWFFINRAVCENEVNPGKAMFISLGVYTLICFVARAQQGFPDEPITGSNILIAIAGMAGSASAAARNDQAQKSRDS